MARRRGKKSRRRRKEAREAQNSITAVRARESSGSNGSANGAPIIFVPEPPTVFNPSEWAGPDGEIGRYITDETRKILNAYVEDPDGLDEDAQAERFSFRGGYATRQLVELVQNSADALKHRDGKIVIRITDDYLYCADEGMPITTAGVRSLMRAHLSSKQGTEFIGQFGLGFKSVLAITDAPEFFSRSGSFVFDRDKAEKRIREKIPGDHPCPVLRLPEPLDPVRQAKNDDVLREMMSWAKNIVRLPLKRDAYSRLQLQFDEFKPECLFFMPGVNQLVLIDNLDEWSVDFSIKVQGQETLLESKGSEAEFTKSGWRLFSKSIRLSDTAREDYQTDIDPDDEIDVAWAVPLDRMNEPGDFWAYFPTTESCIVAGIVNARWKTNEDRQNLLPGPYNEELIEAVSELIANNLHQLAIPDDPARHLDALPRRREAGDDEYADELRTRLFDALIERDILPNLDGQLVRTDAIRFPPSIGSNEETREVYSDWATWNHRRKDWLHPSALRSRERIAKVGRLSENAGAEPATLPAWLEVLVEGVLSDEAIRASKTAIRIASRLPLPRYPRDRREFGKIILTQSGDFASPNGSLYLPSAEGTDWPGRVPVHHELANDPSIRRILITLGVQEASTETRFESLVNRSIPEYSFESRQVSDNHWRMFWDLSRNIDVDRAESIVRDRYAWRSHLRLKTIGGAWNPIHSVLLPGLIVPGDGSRDRDIAVDIDFHRQDIELIRSLGISDQPQDGWDSSFEPGYRAYRSTYADEFQHHAYVSTGRRPQLMKIDFAYTKGIGPVHVFSLLSEESKARFTDALISEKSTFEPWIIEHETQSQYGTMPVPQPAISALEEHGHISTSAGIVHFADALGENPTSPEAQRILLGHPNASLIREAFNLHDAHRIHAANFEPAEPIQEVWPGLQSFLPHDLMTIEISRCQWFEDEYGLRIDERSALIENVIYLSRMDDIDELREVCTILHVSLDEDALYAILDQPTPREIKDARNGVAKQPDDAHRLLTAVGADNLRSELPDSLIAYYERNGRVMSGIELAEAAFATYHTGALKQYRRFLERFKPPKRWTSGPGTVDFVRSLGFSAEWAGDPNSMPDPFIEIPGPFDLPEEHDYQRKIIDNLSQMLARPSLPNAGRRGLISLPTGSGKTRVAVQGIVEAMKNGHFEGGVLWVANRDELCEQAVESWQQVWSAIGAERTVLRVSRMWGGQKRPAATNERHVVVATIQTLLQRMVKRSQGYEFLRDFSLIVFDEAHGSIAPSFNAVLREIGFGRVQRPDDPFLLGLTATPYRGRNEPETRWLVNRYDGNRLDNGVFRSNDASKVVGELQRREILAYVDHDVIAGGDYSVSAAQVAAVRGMPWLDQQTELQIALDAVRTDRIIEAYERFISHSNPDWPTLIFAISVDHAKGLAAILNRRGVSARAVWSDTERYTRRQLVEQFRAGDLNVLVNYGVFREGFDAPKTRAIIVARPVFSPNAYFQMIGRGLRGIQNGGNERCLILDVNDNIENFDRELAFTEMDWLWD